jgi:hypothetical protein
VVRYLANGRPPRGRRGEVKGFSSAARLRLFRLINSCDLDCFGRSTFATYTWHDTVGMPEISYLTRSKSWMHRSFERVAGGKFPAIWRVEWKRRQSGIYIGEYMPHVHVLYVGCPYVHREEIERCWGVATGAGRPVWVDLREAKNVRQCMHYISKYLAKVLDSGQLGISAYLNANKRGRSWGVYRRNLLPASSIGKARLAPGKVLDDVRKLAHEAWSKVEVYGEAGFTLFGPAVQKIKERLKKELDWGSRIK